MGAYGCMKVGWYSGQNIRNHLSHIDEVRFLTNLSFLIVVTVVPFVGWLFNAVEGRLAITNTLFFNAWFRLVGSLTNMHIGASN